MYLKQKKHQNTFECNFRRD